MNVLREFVRLVYSLSTFGYVYEYDIYILYIIKVYKFIIIGSIALQHATL